MPLRTGPSRAKGISINYRVLMKSRERTKITQLTVSLLSQNLRIYESKKMKSVSTIRSACFGQKNSEPKFSGVCIILFINTLIFSFLLPSLLVSFETSF